MSIQAMKQALDFINTMPYQHNPEAIRVSTALRAAIEAAEKVEPKREHVCGLQGFGALDDVCPACTTPQPAIPAGWQLVPVEPTQEMLDAANSHEHMHLDIMYRVMLAAAPKEMK